MRWVALAVLDARGQRVALQDPALARLVLDRAAFDVDAAAEEAEEAELEADDGELDWVADELEGAKDDVGGVAAPQGAWQLPPDPTTEVGDDDDADGYGDMMMRELFEERE